MFDFQKNQIIVIKKIVKTLGSSIENIIHLHHYGRIFSVGFYLKTFYDGLYIVVPHGESDIIFLIYADFRVKGLRPYFIIFLILSLKKNGCTLEVLQENK